MDPTVAHAYYNRGLTYRGKGDYEQAIGDFDKALELDPKNAKAYSSRGVAYAAKGDHDRAIRDFDQAIELNPAYAHGYNNLAWILATHPEPQLRDGAEAVRLAERACELTHYESPATLDTLGAAYAEAGQFDQAVKTAQQAIQLALAAGNEELAKDVQRHLQLYRAEQPWRE